MPAFISALLIEYYLAQNPQVKILHDTRVVRVIDDAIERCGGAGNYDQSRARVY